MNLLSTSKKKVIVSLIFFTTFSALSLFLVEGLTKHDLLICEFLFAISSILICINISKENKIIYNIIMCAMALAFLLFVPSRMYYRTELLINDMLTLYEGTTILNVVIILMIIAILLFVTQSTALSFGITGIVCFIFAVLNFYVNSFRGSPLSLSDLLAIRTAVSVMVTYDYSFSAELWKSIAYFITFISIGFFIKIDIKKVSAHIVLSIVSIIIFLGSFLYYKAPSSWATPGLDGNGTLWYGEAPFGEYLYFIRSFEATTMRKEPSYSNNKLTEINNKIVKSSSISNLHPNIIMIMNEAWSDLSVLGNIETTEPVMPFYDSLKASKNSVTGYTYVNIQGGMTADTEFEALTGDTLSFLDISAVPFQMQVNHPMASLATVLSKQGYDTVAMHPNGGASWNRNIAYDHLGFDKSLFIDDFSSEIELIGSYVSDACNYKEIITQYENRNNANPWFMFNVTIQNHSAYWSQTDIVLEATKVGNTLLPSKNESDEYKDLNVYLNLMKISDNSIAELIEYFKNVSEPTIICMFGDHQPLLSEQFYNTIFNGSNLTADEQKALQFLTPYFIWANYDIDFEYYGDISASYLAPIICDVANVQLPPYYEYIMNFRKEVPFFNRYTMSDYDNSIFEDYRILMYNHLMENEYRKDIFEIN